MSTLFGILKNGKDIILEDDMLPVEEYEEDDFLIVAYRGNRGAMVWENELAKFLPENMKVYPLDNSAQGIYTIGDIKREIK